jgi:hypothetical protein
MALTCPASPAGTYVTMITMETVTRQAIVDEDQLVAELHQLGIPYLSNRQVTPPQSPRSPEQLLADIIQQPSSRVRTAVIGVLLIHPDYAGYVPTALGLLSENQRQLLKLFYTAAVYLQRIYQNELSVTLGTEPAWLPDLFDEDLANTTALSPQDAIQQLGIRHQELTHSMTNWAGTYKYVAQHLIRYKQREAQWNHVEYWPTPKTAG